MGVLEHAVFCALLSVIHVKTTENCGALSKRRSVVSVHKGENKSVTVASEMSQTRICTCIMVPSQVTPSPVKPDRHVHVTPLPGNKKHKVKGKKKRGINVTSTKRGKTSN